jgi:5-methyltetrahydrofolate--homocysteine methyltransferase
VVSSLLNEGTRLSFTDNIRKEYDILRKSYAGAARQQEYISLGEARKNCFKIDWYSQQLFRPVKPGIQIFEDYSIDEIRPYISWMYFFVAWQLRGKFPDILTDPVMGEEATKLYRDANEMLDRITAGKWLTAKATFGLFPANSNGDDIEIYSNEKRTDAIFRFINLRNQTKKNDKTPNYCLADFIAPKETGLHDYLGAFAVTAGTGIEDKLRDFENDRDDYSSIMIKILADRLAEAFTELIHLKVRKEFWGYQPDENLGLEDLLLEKYKGIRPAHGYPACPDHSEKITLFSMLDAEKTTGISLTENFSMYPAASVSGLIFAHPQSRYFFVGKIGRDQVDDYARRKNTDIATIERWLASNLNYDPALQDP